MLVAVVALLTASLTVALAATYKPAVIRAGNLVVKVGGGIWPSILPKHELTPVKTSIAGRLRTVDGSPVPPVKNFSVNIDKSFAVDAKGLPACPQSRIEARSTAGARKACPKSIVGSGSAEAEVAFPEQKPFIARGPLVFFNGGVHGKTTLLLVHLYAAVPAPTAIVTPVKVTRISKGNYGLEASANVPLIAGGYGSVTSFKFSLGRDFAYKGQKRGYIEASCPRDKYLAEAHVAFRDGSSYKATVVLPCASQGSAKHGYGPAGYVHG